MIFDVLTLILSTFIAIKSIFRIISNRYSLLHLCLIVYYLMQCLPIAFQLLYGLDSMKTISPIFYKAMTDERVSYIYNVLSLLTCILLYAFADKFSIRKHSNIFLIVNNFKPNLCFIVAISILMFLPPIVAVVFSPSPSIYFEYAYFYRLDKGGLYSIERLYHYGVVIPALFFSFAFVLLRYFFKKHTDFINCIDVYICIFLITWINQKRTILVFLLLGILAIDFFKRNYGSFSSYLKKCFAFLMIIIGYFVYYANVAKSLDSNDFFRTYTIYFSRLNVEKVAIFDQLYDNRLLDYKGQSLIFDLFSWIPRSVWPSKPGMYTKYFTAYVETGYGSQSFWQPYNLQVNIWGDWVSSLGVLGHFAALVFIIWIIRKSELSDNMITCISGVVFVLLYLMFGFEGIVMYSFYIWILSMLYTKFSKVRILVY